MWKCYSRHFRKYCAVLLDVVIVVAAVLTALDLKIGHIFREHPLFVNPINELRRKYMQLCLFLFTSVNRYVYLKCDLYKMSSAKIFTGVLVLPVNPCKQETPGPNKIVPDQPAFGAGQLVQELFFFLLKLIKIVKNASVHFY